MLTPNTDIESVLRRDPGASRWRWLRRPIVLIPLALLIGAGAVYLWAGGSSETAVTYTTTAAKRGDLVIEVSATGTVEPVNKVDISSELSGTIAAVNVDFNDPVTAGEVLAVVNTDKLQSQADSSRANLAVAQAAVEQAGVTLEETKRALERVEALASRNIATQEEVDSATAAHDRAVAALASARAQVSVAEANLAGFEIDLGKAEIKSPINGVVLDRNIDPGATVAASLSAPVLFTIAEDLRKMRVLVDVDEADAGSVDAGQPATFTVDAYPDRTFTAQVQQLRYAATTTNNVVTYTCVLTVDNSDLAIRPGMTATASIVVSQERDRLLIPNAALRYAPVIAAARTSGGGFLGNLFRPPQSQTGGGADTSLPEGKRRIWVLRDGTSQPVLVTPGASDGNWTIVLDGEVATGDAVITAAATSS